MTDRTDAQREEAATELADQALDLAPGLLNHVAAIIAGLAGIMTGRKVVAIQSIERPIEARENAGSGQWDHYVRVMDQVDHDEPAGNA